MRKSLRLLLTLLKILSFVAEFVAAVFTILQQFPQLKKLIGRFANSLLPLLALPFWFWPSITLTGAVLLLFLVRRKKLIKLGRLPAQALSDQQLRRKIRRHLTFSRFAKHYRELAGLYYCTRRDPECSPVHGAALVLTATSSPFSTFTIMAWLRQKLTSTPHGFSYPLPALKILAVALSTQIAKRHWSWLWPKNFQKTFRQLAMDTYNAVAHYSVEALERTVFFHWQVSWLPQHLKEPSKAFFKHDGLLQCQEEWKRDLEDSTNTALNLFETIADPVYDKWLNQLDTPPEVEEAAMKLIPTLFAVSANVGCTDSQVATIVSKIQELAKKIAPVIWRSRQEYEFEIWLNRLQLILKTNVLVFLWRWLDTGHKLAVLEKTFAELNLLYKDGYDHPVETNDLFAEFDQVLQQIHDQKKIDHVPGGFQRDQAEKLVEQVKSSSKRAREVGALPIAIICEKGIIPKLESILDFV